jgi:predicted N-acetyltransferase YhbS
VKPAHIGKRVGRRLLEHARGEASKSGARCVLIQIDPNAEPFYRRAGAKRVGERASLSMPGRQLPLYKLVVGDGPRDKVRAEVR